MPAVVSRPRLWMSVMKTIRPARRILSLTPNSLAVLIELIKSPPPLARPSTCALEACAFIR
ncbi:hypothetical protein D3C72_1837710 [compost metagenome]